MKQVKRIFGVLLALVMMLALGVSASAQNVGSGEGGSASITVSNASKGETYKVYKLFDATVTGTENGSIAYTGEIPESLNAYFEKDSAGNVSLKNGADETALVAALKTWASTATAVAEAKSDGSALTFSNLAYGYYVVTSTQGSNSITVTSTNPNATVVDKNSTEPVKNLTKTADSENKDYNIGDTVTYTVSFDTSNYIPATDDTAAKQIASYTIKDTLPNFLSDVTVTEIQIGDAKYKVNGNVPQFANGEIAIPWAQGGTSLYANGAKITVTYTATLADGAAIDGQGNANEVTITYKTTDNTTGGGGTNEKKTETIYTYAIALQKVDQAGKALAGATFQLPFYVKEATDATDGAYIYAGTEAGTGLANSVTTPDDGLIIIKGVKAGTYSVTETKAPDGYNRLTSAVEVKAEKLSATTTSTTTYLDKDGNVVATETTGGSTVKVESNKIAASVKVVVNKTGASLPTTGGIGTTIFYVVGAILVLGAGVLLVVRRRMDA